MNPNVSRRALVSMICLGPVLAAATAVESARAFTLEADDGSPIRNFGIDESLVIARFSQAQRFARGKSAVRLFELFDYNCGYCRGAGKAIDEMLAADQSVELVLVHHPIVSSASVDAASLQQAVFLHHGAERAYDLHLALMTSRGPVNGARVRSICREMGLDGFSDNESVLAVAQVASMTKAAIALGLKFTPSFILADTAFIGWPGRGTLDAMIAAKRQCGQVQCA